MANRQGPGQDHFYNWSSSQHSSANSTNANSDDGDTLSGRVVRRSELAAIERGIANPAREGSTSSKPVLQKPKRKRRPPKIPWKKPKDMPKRPLSAYNLFFAHERERLLREYGGSPDSSLEGKPSAAGVTGALDDGGVKPMEVKSSSPRSDNASDEDLKASASASPSSNTSSPSSQTKKRRHTKSSGIGFANLAKTVSVNWKNLDPVERAVFEKRAEPDRQRYQREMVVWRAKEQKRKTEEEGKEGKLKTNTTLGRRNSTPMPSSTLQPTVPSTPTPRRRSEPIPKFSFSFDAEEFSTDSDIEEPMDGASLASGADVFEDTLHLDPLQDNFRQMTTRRSFSDSHLDTRVQMDVSPLADAVFPNQTTSQATRPAGGTEETKEGAATLRATSWQALQDSLDDEAVDFLTSLNFRH